MAHTSFLCSSADVPHRGQHPHECGLARNTALSSSIRNSCLCFSADVRPGPLGQGQRSGPWHVPVPPPAPRWVAGPVSLGHCCSGSPGLCCLISFPVLFFLKFLRPRELSPRLGYRAGRGSVSQPGLEGGNPKTPFTTLRVGQVPRPAQEPRVTCSRALAQGYPRHFPFVWALTPPIFSLRGRSVN